MPHPRTPAPLVTPLLAAGAPLCWNAAVDPRLPFVVMAPFALLAAILWLLLPGFLRAVPPAARLPWALALGFLSPLLAFGLVFPFACLVPILDLALVYMAADFVARPLPWLAASLALGTVAWLEQCRPGGETPSMPAVSCPQ